MCAQTPHPPTRLPVAARLDFESAALRLGYNTHKLTMIALEQINRFSKPPFTGQSDHAFGQATESETAFARTRTRALEPNYPNLPK